MRRGLLSLAVALVALAALDLGLRAADVLPPDDPLQFFLRTREPVVDPFVPAGPGRVAIRPDWVNDGEGLRGRSGRRAGRQFLLPGFRPAELATPKPPGTLRVFALGGSTTYGLYVGADDAFPARLERLLAERAPGREVEVVNLGCPGFASDRVAALLRSVLRFEPDLLVVLSGQNEMLAGPDPGLSPALRARARLLGISSLFAWWNHFVAGTLRSAETEQVREEAAALRAGEIPTYVPEAVPETRRDPPSDAFRAAAREDYARNLEAMVSAAHRAGVPLVVAIPAANLRAGPGIGVHSPDFADGPAFAQAMRAARARLDGGQPARALESVEQALALSPDHAVVHALRGEALLALGRVAEARLAFQAALDTDARTHHVTGPLTEAALRVLRGSGAGVVDLRPLFHARLDRDGARTLFVDHVHPTALGHALIARALLPVALEALTPGPRVPGAE